MPLEYGCTRLVILTRRYAIKLPQLTYTWRLFLLGLLANMQEINFSKAHDERLCPIRFYIPGGWLTIMPRCTPLTDTDFANMDIAKFWPSITENYDPNDVTTYDVPVENKQDSFGYYKGRIVAIDYGS